MNLTEEYIHLKTGCEKVDIFGWGEEGGYFAVALDFFFSFLFFLVLELPTRWWGTNSLESQTLSLT